MVGWVSYSFQAMRLASMGVAAGRAGSVTTVARGFLPGSTAMVFQATSAMPFLVDIQACAPLVSVSLK